MFVRLGDRLVAQKDVALTPNQGWTEETRFVTGDHLGSSSLMTNDAGAVTFGAKYDPYGQMRTRWGTQASDQELDPGMVEELFNGKQREQHALGLVSPYPLEAYDYGARWYLPTTSTWLSADPVTPDIVDEANARSSRMSRPLSLSPRRGRSRSADRRPLAPAPGPRRTASRRPAREGP